MSTEGVNPEDVLYREVDPSPERVAAAMKLLREGYHSDPTPSPELDDARSPAPPLDDKKRSSPDDGDGLLPPGRF